MKICARKRCGQLVGPLLLTASLICTAIVLTKASKSEETTTNTTTTKLQARISLESKNLDIDDRLTTNGGEPPVVGATNTTKIRKKAKKERSSRRLSNIWSMFLPGSSSSSSDQDYEESQDGSSESDEAASGESGGSSSSGVLATTTTTQSPEILNDRMGSSLELVAPTSEKHDEKLVAKYSRPPRQNGSELLPISQASSPPTSELIGTTLAPSSSGGGLITGSLSGDSAAMSLSSSGGQQSPDMNDIVSTIMGSMSSANATSETTTTASNQVEREDESPLGNRTVQNQAGDQHFEQWLDRIQFKGSHRPTTTTTTNQPQSQTTTMATPSQPQIKSSKPHKLAPGDVLRAMEALAAERARQQQQQQKSAPAIILRATKTTGSELQQHHHHRQLPNLPRSAPSKMNHLSQQQQQLQHYPYRLIQQQHHKSPAQFLQMRQKSPSSFHNKLAQASTLSVNTMDANSSQPAPPANTTMNNDEQQQSVELSSQDEILKQVTSAIDFEQKLQNQRRQQQQQLGLGGDPEGANELESLSKLFKAGGASQQDEPTNATSGRQPSAMLPMELLKASMSSTSNSSADNFDSIAEKLRQLAQQQQQPVNNATSTGNGQRPQQPTWLRPPVVGALPSLLAAHEMAGANNNTSRLVIGDRSQSAAMVERLRELMERHERNKSELKSSQEKMELLMRQLMLEAPNAVLPVLPSSGATNKPRPLNQQQQQQQQQMLLVRQKVQQLIKPPMNQQQQQQQQVPPEGWKPVAPLMSPAQLIKGAHQLNQHHSQAPPRFRQPPLRISQLQDNLGSGHDYLNDDSPANLGLMFAQARQHLRAGADPSQGDQQQQQQLLGLPIAVLKEVEAEREEEELDLQQHHHKRLSDPNNHQLLALNGQSAAMEQQAAAAGGEQPDYQHQQELAQQLDLGATGGAKGLAAAAAVAQDRRPGDQQQPDLQRAHSLGPELLLRQAAANRQRQHQQATGGGGGGNGNGYAPVATLRPPVMAQALAQQGSGLPVRFREISVYRPFGYESHHAIAYQASPAVAALFPGLAQTGRPSVLRHMTPFRAIQTQRGLLNPLQFSGGDMTNPIRAAATSPAAYFEPPSAASYNDELAAARNRFLRLGHNLQH